MQREPVGEDSLVRLLGRQMLMHSLKVLKVQSWSYRLLLSEATSQWLPHILCLRSQWSGTILPGPTEFPHTNPLIRSSEHKELSPEKAIQPALPAAPWK